MDGMSSSPGDSGIKKSVKDIVDKVLHDFFDSKGLDHPASLLDAYTDLFHLRIELMVRMTILMTLTGLSEEAKQNLNGIDFQLECCNNSLVKTMGL